MPGFDAAGGKASPRETLEGGALGGAKPRLRKGAGEIVLRFGVDFCGYGHHAASLA